MLCACDNDTRKEAEKLLETANRQYANGQYDKALGMIDSIRTVFPNSVEIRKRALELYQNISLKKAQEELARTDSMLQAVTNDYNYIKTKVEKDKAELRATAEELRKLNEMKVRLDSLKVCFDTECAKIKYIHKKQKEK